MGPSRNNSPERGIFDEDYSSSEEELDLNNQDDDDDDENDRIDQETVQKEQLQIQYRMTVLKYLKLKSKFNMALNL